MFDLHYGNEPKSSADIRKQHAFAHRYSDYIAYLKLHWSLHSCLLRK